MVESQGQETTTIETTGAEGASQAATTPEGAAEAQASPTPGAAPEPVVTKAGAAAAPAKPAYTPNFKFKVLDKEHEFDDFVRGAIKDADTEKKLRDIYERAYGLDSVKSDRQTLKGELSTLKDRLAKTDGAIETLNGFIGKNDYDSVFDALGISKDKILRYAVELVQRDQWTPEQKASWEAGRSAQQQAAYYQQQNQQLMQSQQQLAVQQRSFELERVVSAPDISAVAQAYDAGMGTPGAFREYVIRIGQAYAAQGKDIPAAEAVQEAVKHLRAVNPSLGVSAGAAAPASNVVAGNTKPVIPNIQGRGTSAVKSTIRTLDDLKKRAREMEAMG